MWTLTVLSAIVFLLRLWWLPRGAEGWDAVDFILAVDDYDLERFQPHFPGYPLYVLAARIVHACGVSAEAAYRLVNAFCGAMLPLALHGALFPPGGGKDGPSPSASPRRSELALFLVTLSPALLLASVRIESDLPGLLLIILAFRAGVSGRPVPAALLAGLTLGVRLGAAPLVAGWAIWLLRRGRSGTDGKARCLPVLGGFLAGVAVWLVPLLAIAGSTLWREAVYFVGGHFRDWGGSAFSGEGWLQRWSSLGSNFGRVLAGTPRAAGVLAALAFVAAGGFFLWRQRRMRVGVFPYLLIPQVLTLAFLQNPGSSRHYYPVVLAVVAAASLGFLRQGGPVRVVGLLLLLAWGVHGLGLLARRSVELPPSLAAVRAVLATNSAAGDSWIFCGATKRLFDLEDPRRRVVVKRARDFQGVLAELNGSLAPPASILVFSEVEGIPQDFEPLSFRGAPAIYDTPAVDIYHCRVKERTPGGELSVEVVDPSPGLDRRADR